MKFLFVHYIPSGGVDSLNRHRCKALRTYGHEGHCLYYAPGSGYQNITDTPTFITNEDSEIHYILMNGEYNAIVVTTDYGSFPRFRNLGYSGKLILEIQGYGPQSVARSELTNGIACIENYASALLNPKTAHIDALFAELFPQIPRFNFNNPFDSKAFTYQRIQKFNHPILGWIGRIEDNKNWREFLEIGNMLIKHYNEDIRLWMFEDPNLSSEIERRAFMDLVESLELGPYLSIFPNVANTDMANYYSIIGDSGGMLCLTSKEEGGPYCVLEAMSCRCPILTSRKDGILSTIYHNNTGKIYSLGNVTEAFIEAVDLMQDTAKRENIRTNAQAHVQAGFTLEQYAHYFISMVVSLKN